MSQKLLPLIIFALLAFSSLNAIAEDTTFTTSHFSGSGNCQTCHDNLTDNAGDDVSIVKDWGTSMMANASKDPFWQAKVASELKRNPALSSVINDTCSRCHAPAANYEIGGDITLFGPDGVLDTTHALHDAGMNGVTCTVCHQITDDASLGSLSGFSGQFNINDSKTIYGQYANITPQPMINNTGYTPAYSAHISDSKLCATCHNLKTPFVDANGNKLSTAPESDFPEQMPYTEWENSIFDDAGSNPQSCQDCHMPKTTSKVSNRPNGLGTKDGFAKHHLVGANTVMLTLLKNNSTQLDVTSADLDLGISRARAMLQGAATIEIVSASVTNGVLQAQIKLTNLSGHKTPTSYPSRRMWINFKVTDSANNIVFESGQMNSDGSIVGSDNDLDQTQYEPHYDLITTTDQVQMYETIMSDSDGNVTYTLLRASHYLKDNRLTPKGFDKLNVPTDVAVMGLAAGDTDFNLGSDELTYRFPITATGNLTVSATLNYQPIMHGFIKDLYRDTDQEQVLTFKTLYDAQSLKHEQIASTQTSVINSGLPAPVVDLSASPTTIAEGESSTLTWSSTDATSCTASGDWSDIRPTSGTELVSPAVTSSYTISCENNAGATASADVTVTVEDRTAPVITPPADIQIEIAAGTSLPYTESAIVAFLDGATAVDNVDTTLPSISNDAPATFPEGITIVTFTVADSAGNVGTAQASVTITTDTSNTLDDGSGGGGSLDLTLLLLLILSLMSAYHQGNRNDSPEKKRSQLRGRT